MGVRNMYNRESLHPGRVKMIPVAGQENVYDMTMADDPTQEGTPPTKENLLKDKTAELLGLDDSAVPDRALNRLFDFFHMLNTDSGYINVTVQLQDGTPVPGVCVSNVFSYDGGPVYTDETGSAAGFVKAGSVTIGIENCIDISETPTKISVDSGVIYKKVLTVSQRSSVTIESSGNWYVSGLVGDDHVDITGVGGGGGGSGLSGNNTTIAGGGGGGGYVVTKTNIALKSSDTLQIVIGSGGPKAVGTSPITASAGGTTTVTKNGTGIISAQGGNGGTTSSTGTGGTGNGNGGNSNASGGNGTGYIFNESSLGLAGGGGGGGGSQGTGPKSGGLPYGADSGYYYYYSSVISAPATEAGYGGGGGGGIHSSTGGPSDGGKGVVYIRRSP